ncbi:MAG: hypothetical protein K5905_17770 [Roseibium sp.]|uniref:hypothetical protein n=1 Tax=Roseibium sp. TaxID=1936156 RepID=UPI002633F75A|nr:hypothetical protein [Roseibium sp.]MCV0427313.1 hypothetical protein [Roseibium sp.]
MRLIISCLTLLLISTFAQADTVRETVPANKASVVGSQATILPGCLSGAAPDMKVTMAPKHGTVSFKRTSGTLNEEAGRCAGKTVKGTLVIYKPNRGYRGEDVFKIGFTMDMYVSGSAKIRNVVDKYVIKVK